MSDSPPTLSFSWLISSTLAAALVAAGLLWQYWPWAGNTQTLAVNCTSNDEQQHCHTYLPTGERIELGRSGALRSLALQQLWLDSTQSLDNVRVTMEGRDMYVGRLHYPLQPAEQTQWHGRGAVGNCIDDDMPWLAHFQFQHQGQPYQATLMFTIRDGVFP